MQGCLVTSWYAIRLNDRYWLGHHAVDPTGSSGVLAPSLAGAMLLPTDSNLEIVTRFRNLAKEHGGQIVKLDLDMTTLVDEMLRSKFEGMEKTSDDVEGTEDGGQH